MPLHCDCASGRFTVKLDGSCVERGGPMTGRGHTRERCRPGQRSPRTQRRRINDKTRDKTRPAGPRGRTRATRGPGSTPSRSPSTPPRAIATTKSRTSASRATTAIWCRTPATGGADSSSFWDARSANLESRFLGVQLRTQALALRTIGVISKIYPERQLNAPHNNDTEVTVFRKKRAELKYAPARNGIVDYRIPSCARSP